CRSQIAVSTCSTVLRTVFVLLYIKKLEYSGTKSFHQVPAPAENGEVAHDGVPFLDHIISAQQYEWTDHGKGPEEAGGNPDSKTRKKKAYDNGKADKIMTHGALFFFLLNDNEYILSLLHH